MIKIAMLLLVSATALADDGCNGPPIKTGDTTKTEMEQTEINHKRLVQAVPPPQLTNSLERKNLVRRLEHINRDNMVSYVYLVSYGRVMAFYTVSGKVSSLNSFLTTPEQIVNYCPYNSSTSHCEGHVLPSPDFDGSYGKNADGIFFFTTEGAYVEWQGEYLWADQPLKLTTAVELVQAVDAAPKK